MSESLRHAEVCLFSFNFQGGPPYCLLFFFFFFFYFFFFFVHVLINLFFLRSIYVNPEAL